MTTTSPQVTLQELREVLRDLPTAKQIADFMEHATPEQRGAYIEAVARLMIEINRPALKELERY